MVYSLHPPARTHTHTNMIRVRTSVSNAFAPETKIVHHRATTAASEQKESGRAGSSVRPFKCRIPSITTQQTHRNRARKKITPQLSNEILIISTRFWVALNFLCRRQRPPGGAAGVQATGTGTPAKYKSTDTQAERARAFGGVKQRLIVAKVRPLPARMGATLRRLESNCF